MTRCVRVCVCFTFSFVCFIVDVFVCNLVFVLTIHAKLLSSLFWMSTNNIIRKSTPKYPLDYKFRFTTLELQRQEGKSLFIRFFPSIVLWPYYTISLIHCDCCCCFLPQCFILLRQQKPTAFFFSFLFFSSTIDLYVRLLEIGGMRR